MAAKMTITEALAEIKTITARVEKKRAAVMPYLVRDGRVIDPHEKDGGSVGFVGRERQGIHDLEERLVAIRTAIQRKNLDTSLTLEGETRSLAAWLTWRREVSAGSKTFLSSIASHIQGHRQRERGRSFVQPGNELTKPEDIIVAVNEAALSAEIEQMETLLGTLDGKLSLLNATITIDI